MTSAASKSSCQNLLTFNGIATYSTQVMLRASSLPPRFWAEAIATFMYLRNRTPTVTNEGMSSSTEVNQMWDMYVPLDGW